MDTDRSVNKFQKWDFAILEFWYRNMLNPDGQHEYYDAELHYRTAESLLSEIHKSPSTNPFDKLSAE